jgi:inosine-uridine nucleoside N-ribohydrolase
MSGLDVTHKLQATPERIEKVRALPGKLAGVLADLLVYFSNVYINNHDNMRGGAVHDPIAVLALTHPELLTMNDHHVVVETSGVHTRGMTLVDMRQLKAREKPNCTVVWDVDAEAVFNVIVESIGAFSK